MLGVPLSRGTQIPEYVLQGSLAAFKSRNRPILFLLKSDLPIFRTFGADKSRSPLLSAINNRRDFKRSTVPLFPKIIQVVDWHRLVRSFLFEAAPKVRKIRFECSATAPGSPVPGIVAACSPSPDRVWIGKANAQNISLALSERAPSPQQYKLRCEP
jgi:hypothetical protein